MYHSAPKRAYRVQLRKFYLLQRGDISAEEKKKMTKFISIFTVLLMLMLYLHTQQETKQRLELFGPLMKAMLLIPPATMSTEI